jgi:hypothetical protein
VRGLSTLSLEVTYRYEIDTVSELDLWMILYILQGRFAYLALGG